jgi:hypothetical protein
MPAMVHAGQGPAGERRRREDAPDVARVREQLPGAGLDLAAVGGVHAEVIGTTAAGL